jgi:hypothetical protein
VNGNKNECIKMKNKKAPSKKNVFPHKLETCSADFASGLIHVLFLTTLKIFSLFSNNIQAYFAIPIRKTSSSKRRSGPEQAVITDGMGSISSLTSLNKIDFQSRCSAFISMITFHSTEWVYTKHVNVSN